MSVPALFITYNRLRYTQESYYALLKSDVGDIFIIDNNSTDGTQDFIMRDHGSPYPHGLRVILNKENKGIAGAFNQFLELTKDYRFICKVDCDTLIPTDFIKRMLPHMQNADLVQAKHTLIPASAVGTFDEWVSKMPGTRTLKFNHFIGGSGILCRRSVLSKLPITEDKLMSWRQWQKEHPEIRKAFCTDVEVELLDAGGYPEEYLDYYRLTGRI